MNVLIIEDEKPAARRLQRMLNEINIEVNTMLHSVEESIAWFSNNEHPDLIFLDIQLSDGLSFEIFDAVTIKSSIIFTTAYDEYALKAFKLNSIDYLLKPIDDEDLEIAINKYREYQPQQSNMLVDFESIKALLVNPIDRTYKKRFTTKVGQHLKIFNIEDIECFYSQDKGTFIHTTSHRNYLIDNTLETLEKDLNPEVFYRVNRKFYVNINAIKDIVAYTNSRLQIKLNHFDEGEIIVARERVTDFKKWIE